MPINPRTGKTDRHASTIEELLKFRTKQAEQERAAEVKKGKQHARGSPDAGAGEPEDSNPVPSPSITLAGLGGLNLESGGSSPANTPTGSQPVQSPCTERPAPGPSRTPKACRVSRRSAGKSASKVPVTAHTHHSSGFVVEVPTRSQLLMPDAVHPQASRSHSEASQASDDGSLAARVKLLE